MWAYEIFIPIAIVVGIGLVLGLVLAIAAIILHVPIDERVEAVTKSFAGRQLWCLWIFRMFRLCHRLV